MKKNILLQVLFWIWTLLPVTVNEYVHLSDEADSYIRSCAALIVNNDLHMMCHGKLVISKKKKKKCHGSKIDNK